VSADDVDGWRQALPGVAVAAISSGDVAYLGTHEAVRSARVDPAFFDAIGVRPVIGGFQPEDFGPYTDVRPALLTDRLWRTRFRADPTVVGRTFIDAAETGRGIRVAGILPPDFVFPFSDGVAYAPTLLTPIPQKARPSPGRERYVILRVTSPDTPEGVAARLDALVSAAARARPRPTPRPGASERSRVLSAGVDTAGLVPLHAALTERIGESAWVVFAAATCLVLLACLNVAGLTGARVRDRWRELAVRRALGASGADLTRGLFAEHALLAALGVAVGLALAQPLLPWTARLVTNYLVIIKSPAIDVRVVAYAALLSLMCVAITTALSTRAATRASLRTAGANGGGTTRRELSGRIFLGFEVALALVVTTASALVAGSLIRVEAEDPGFSVRDAGVVSMAAPRGSTAAQIDRLMLDIASVPGVSAAGGVDRAFLQRAFNGSAFDAPTTALPEVAGALPIESVPVTRGFFAATGLAALDGRLPTADELAAGAPVIAVTALVAQRYWPNRRAVGQVLMNRGRPFDVVGVVPDTRFMALDLEPRGEIYWSVTAEPSPSLSSVVVQLDANTPIASVASEIIRRCPGCWVRKAEMLSDSLGATIRHRQFSAWLFSAFGVSALAITAAGIFGLVAMASKRRTREIGVRMALGATRGAVIRQMVREQLGAALVGLLAGGLASAWLTRFLTSYLYKTPVYDPWAWSAAVLVLIAVALAATLIPSRHAAGIDPMRALRVD
jgi:predicted permease